MINELEPATIVMSQAEAYGGRIVDERGKELTLAEQLKLRRTSYDSILTKLATLTPHSGIIQDNPRLDYDPNTCLVRSGATAESCASPRAEALDATSALQARVSGSALEHCHSLTGSGSGGAVVGNQPTKDDSEHQ